MPDLVERLETDFGCQISPLWIGLLDQINFPVSMPVFELLLAGDRRRDVWRFFNQNQPFDAIAFGEALSDGFAMFDYPAQNVGCDADVECAAYLAGKNVDVWHLANLVGSWILKQVQDDEGGGGS